MAGEQGVALVEALVAAAIAGMALVVFLGGMSTGLLSTSRSDSLSKAHELARSQLEYTKAATYSPAPYSYPTVTPPPGFGVSAAADPVTGGDAKIEQITVTVSQNGAVVYTLQGYKVNR
ncbi:MAG: hypothetical protein ACYDEB_06790 [Dehalococcoidia bacterium]